MNQINLYDKTKQILQTNEMIQKYNTINGIKDNNKEYYYFMEQYDNPNLIDKNLNHSYDHKYILQKNNQRILNLNKSIKDDKSIISNILSPMKSDIQKEEKFEQIKMKLNQLNKIKSMYNINSIQLQNDFKYIKNKKNKLILVYNSLYYFKQKLLKKEKQIQEKEYKIRKFENNLKANENILRNNLEAFSNYMNYQTQNLVNRFKNIKKFHDQREEELRQKENKIAEYEIIIRNIIRKKEKENRETLIKCVNIGEQIEQNMEKEMEAIRQREKEEKIKKDMKFIEKEKEQLEKEKEVIQKEKVKIEAEKEQNKINKKRNSKIAEQMKKREIDFQQNINSRFDIKNQYQTPIRDISNIFDNIYRKKMSIDKVYTPIAFHSYRNKRSNPYLRNKNKYNKDDSFISFENASNHNYSAMIRTKNDQIKPIKKISSYIHDNIYLLQNKSSTRDNNTITKYDYNNKNFKTDPKRSYSSRFSNRINNEKKNIYNYETSFNTYRTINLENNMSKNNLADNTDISNIKKQDKTIEDKSASKYLETNSNENNETYNDINKKIFEIEKTLQLVKSQDKKIQFIKDKLDKKIKNSS